MTRVWTAPAGMATIETKAIHHPKVIAPSEYSYLPYEIGVYLIQLNVQMPSMNAGETKYQQIMISLFGLEPVISFIFFANLLPPFFFV